MMEYDLEKLNKEKRLKNDWSLMIGQNLYASYHFHGHGNLCILLLCQLVTYYKIVHQIVQSDIL